MTAQPGGPAGPGEPGNTQVAEVQPEAEAVGPAPVAAPPAAEPAPEDVSTQIADLADLFRRRLVEDRNNKIALEALHGELREARAIVAGKAVLPLIHRLFQVIDRMDRSPGQLADSIVAELTDILAMYEVDEIRAPTDAFDPAIQEVAAMVEVRDPGADGCVVDVRRRGWRLGPRVLRPVLVDVGRLAGAPKPAD